MHGESAWRGDAMPVHQLVHVHLVPALDDGLRIVDDRHAKRIRPAYELVNDPHGARAVEEAVELGQALQCIRPISSASNPTSGAALTKRCSASSLEGLGFSFGSQRMAS